MTFVPGRASSNRLPANAMHLRGRYVDDFVPRCRAASSTRPHDAVVCAIAAPQTTANRAPIAISTLV